MSILGTVETPKDSKVVLLAVNAKAYEVEIRAKRKKQLSNATSPEGRKYKVLRNITIDTWASAYSRDERIVIGLDCAREDFLRYNSHLLATSGYVGTAHSM
jgi:hypothetical protein